MSDVDPQSLGAMLTSAVALVSAGGAFSKANTKLNMQQKDLDLLEGELREHKTDVTDRLARIETKLDVALGR